MKKILLLPVLSILLFCAPALAEFAKGFDAYQNKDYAAALKEWKPLAEQGDAGAQYSLGWMYDNGLGVFQYYKAAVKWYRLAAEQGDARAQYNLGLKYDNGLGVIQDYKAAVKWYGLAAEQGYAVAQSNLGWMYNNGQGVIQNYTRAYMWYVISASIGFEDAVKNRDIIAKEMTSLQIEQAKMLARECVAKNYKGC
jgi:TPR repeat protein